MNSRPSAGLTDVAGQDRAPDGPGQIIVERVMSGMRTGSIVFAPVFGSIAAMTFCAPGSMENR